MNPIDPKLRPVHGDVIRQLRMARGLDAGQLAERADRSRSMISRYEQGHATPRPSTLSAIARALDAVVPLSDAERRQLLGSGAVENMARPGRSTTSATDSERLELLAVWSEELIESIGIDQMLELLYVAGGIAGIALPGRRFGDDLQTGDRIAWRPGVSDEVYVLTRRARRFKGDA